VYVYTKPEDGKFVFKIQTYVFFFFIMITQP
jgi:hypothetical protein